MYDERIAELEKQLSAAEIDVKRLDWLDYLDGGLPGRNQAVQALLCGPGPDYTHRGAIDAAMKAERGRARCQHERLNMDGICWSCGEDRRRG